MKSPSFQLYVRDAICSLTIKKMTGDEFKAYFFLLCNSWLETPRATLPNIEEDLAAYAGVSFEQWQKIRAGVMKAFTYVDNLEDNLPDKLKDNPQYKGELNLYHNRWYNERLLEVSIKQKKDSDNGKKGGNPNLAPGAPNPYYPKKDNPQDNPSDKPEDKGDDKHSSSSSSSSINNNTNSEFLTFEEEEKKKKKVKRLSIQEMRDLFDPARKLYPGKVRGLETELADFRNKHKDHEEVLPILLASIEKQIKTKQKEEAATGWTPHWKNFKTWLSQRCWEEEEGAITTTTKKDPNLLPNLTGQEVDNLFGRVRS